MGFLDVNQRPVAKTLAASFLNALSLESGASDLVTMVVVFFMFINVFVTITDLQVRS